MAKSKHTHAIGFFGTGIVSRSFLAGLPWLDGYLGPVYSPVKRATPRVVKALGAGFPVSSWEEMRGCRDLLVCAAPEETTTLLVEALVNRVLDHVDTIALVEQSALACIPDEVSAAVKEIGCLSRFPNREMPAYLVEGSLRFRRFCQQLLDVPLRRLVVSNREGRQMVEAGVFLADEFCLPLLEAIQAAFVGAGIASDHAREIGAELLRESVENARYAGRKRWTGILHSEDERRLGQIVKALNEENQLLANLVLGFSLRGLAVMGKRTDWIQDCSDANGDGMNGAGGNCGGEAADEVAAGLGSRSSKNGDDIR